MMIAIISKQLEGTAEHYTYHTDKEYVDIQRQFELSRVDLNWIDWFFQTFSCAVTLVSWWLTDYITLQ
jgi:hypothetical protein